ITTIWPRYEGSVKTSWYPLRLVVNTTSAYAGSNGSGAVPGNQAPSSSSTYARGRSAMLVGPLGRRFGRRRRLLRRGRRLDRERRRLRRLPLLRQVLQHRARPAGIGGHEREHQREEQENPRGPPGDLVKNGRRLAATHQHFGPCAAPQGREPTALPRLEEHGDSEEQRIEQEDDDENGEHRSAGKIPMRPCSAQARPTLPGR